MSDTFPDPEIPDFDETGLMVPPWVKYPNLPFGSIGWRMGSGEVFRDAFAEAWRSADNSVHRALRANYPEPEDWLGFYFNLRFDRVDLEPYRAALLGALVGDALGVPFEFKPPENIPALNEVTLVMPGSFAKSHAAIPYGTWSDDGSQLLCLLETLQEDEEFNPARFAARLIQWLRHGYHQSGGVVFDCGGQTARAIRLLEEGVPPLAAGGTDERSNGNGSLMRTLPVAMMGHLEGWPVPNIVALAHTQSRVTHAHPVSQACCALYCLMAAELFDAPGTRIADSYRSAFAVLSGLYGSTEFAEHAKALAIIDAFPKRNFRRGSGYVVDSLWTAMDCLEKTDSYVGAVLAAIGHGNDTDTTACVVGGLAGIKYASDSKPASGIPEDWIARLRMTHESARVIHQFGLRGREWANLRAG